MDNYYSNIKARTISGSGGLISRHSRSVNMPVGSTRLDTLAEEGGSAFMDYLCRLGLNSEKEIILISFRQHFYYDADELKQARTLVTLTDLNKIKSVTEFVRSCYMVMPPRSNLLGRFNESKGNGRYNLNNNYSSFSEGDYFEDIASAIVSPVPFINRLYSILDSRTNVRMSKSSVSALLRNYGFNVMDMTVLGEFTYFHAQKTRTV